MALTLAEAKATMVDPIDQTVIDEFRRSSLLLDSLTFDDAVAPATGGSTMVYGYTRLETPNTATTRAINTEYTAKEAKRKKHTAELKIFGGAASLDRVIQNTSGQLNEMEFQLKELIKGAKNEFHYLAINGNSATKATEFDGLNKILTGASTEYNTSSAVDISTAAQMEAKKQDFLDMLDEFLSGMEGTPSMLLGNTALINKIKSIARRAGYYSRSEDSFGRAVDNYNGIPLVDLGKYYNGTKSVDVVGTDAAAGTTDLYAVTLDLSGLHAVSPAGGKIISTYLPDMQAPGAVKKVEVEMIAALVLKNSLKAGVFRKIQVAPKTSSGT